MNYNLKKLVARGSKVSQNSSWTPNWRSQELEDLGLKVEPSFDIEQVATEVTTYVQTIIDDMDVEATTFKVTITVVASIYKLTPTNQVVLSVIMEKFWRPCNC